MKLTLAGIAFALFLNTAVAETVVVPAGTSVSVELVENVNSALNRVGDIVYMRVAEDVKVGDQIAVPKGALVEAEVGDAETRGMVGKTGSVFFHPVRVLAADGTWLPLDPTNFGDQGDSASGGMIFAIGMFAKGKAGYVMRGESYRVTIRRDTEVDPGALRPPLVVRSADLEVPGKVRQVKTVKFSAGKIGKDIAIEFRLTPELEGLIPSIFDSFEVVSLVDFVLELPVKSKSVEVDAKKGTLVAYFDWWEIIQFSQPGDTAMIVQFELTDHTRAQTKLTMPTVWK